MSIIFALNPPGSKMAKRRKKKASSRGRRGKRRNPRGRARRAVKKARKAKRRSRRRAKNPRAYMARFPGLGYRSKSGRSRILKTARKVLAQLVARGHAKYGKHRSKSGRRAVYVKARNPRGNRTKLGRSKYLHMLFRGGRKGGATRVQRKHLVKLKLGRRIPRGPYAGMIRLKGRNPADIVGIVSTAAGLGAGVVLAQKVIPALASRISPNLAVGQIGGLVGAVGAIAASKLIARKSPAVAQAVYAGALATIGLSVIKLVVNMLPAAVKGPLGLSGLRGMGDVTPVGAMIRGEAMYAPSMRDYLQLSGPVPESLFAGGLNDYVDFKSRAAGQAAEAISAQIVEWTPTGNEGF